MTSNDPATQSSGTREALVHDVLSLIDSGPAGDPSAFEGLALRVFAHQYANNEPYRAYCDAAGVAPQNCASWEAIPAYPTDAFKNEIVTSFPLNDAVLVQLTSGTTSPNQRGRIFRDEDGKRLVFTANRVMTGAYLFPDFEAGQRCRVLLMAPGPETAPSMGMAIGLDQTRQHFGTEDSMFLVSRKGVDVKALVEALETAERTCVPVALVGSTSAFVYFFNACKRKKMQFSLPAGSRICDGGGYRGRFGVVTRDDFYVLAQEVLGVSESHCVNTLGMAESATNYFDNTLRSVSLAAGTASATGAQGERRKVPPPWARVRAVDPETGAVLPSGHVGLLQFYDLANVPTVLGVQTDNLGFVDDHGFEIIGRAKVVDGRVQELPSERAVGPMGDRRVFRLLEAYVNFSIDFKMGRIASSDRRADYVQLRREQEQAKGMSPEEAAKVTESCPIAVEELVAAGEGPDEASRADAIADALRAPGVPSERDHKSV